MLFSGRIRPLLYSHWSHDNDIVLINHDVSLSTYLDYFKKSKYCLIVRGREVGAILVAVLAMQRSCFKFLRVKQPACERVFYILVIAALLVSVFTEPVVFY